MTLRRKLKQFISSKSFVDIDSSFQSKIELSDSINKSLTSLKLFGKSKIKEETLLDTLIANGKSELLPQEYLDTVTIEGKSNINSSELSPQNPQVIYCNNGSINPNYKRLDYIESNTNLQYLRIPSLDYVSDFIMEFEVLYKGTSNTYKPLMTSNYEGGIYIGGWNNNTFVVGIYGRENKIIVPEPTYNKNIIIKVEKNNGNYYLYFNDILQSTSIINDYIYNPSIDSLLFSDGFKEDSNFANMQLKRFKFNGNINIDLIPAEHNSISGMYDKINKKFYHSSGRNNFVPGPIVTHYIVDNTIPEKLLYTNSKNLLNFKNKTCSLILNSTYKILNNNSVSLYANNGGIGFVFNVIPGKTYKFSFNAIKKNDNSCKLFLSDSYISEGQNWTSKYKLFDINTEQNLYDTVFTAKTSTLFIGLYSYSGNDFDEILLKNISLIECDSILCEDLLQINNYKDTQELISGKITRNIDIKVLDSTENWTELSTNIYSLELDNKKSNLNYNDILSNYFPTVNSLDELNSEECLYGIVVSQNDNTCIIKHSSISNIEDFKNWLNERFSLGNPIIIAYPLQSSIITNTNPKYIKYDPLYLYSSNTLTNFNNYTKSIHINPNINYPLDIICNNGIIKLDNNSYSVDGIQESLQVIIGKNLLNPKSWNYNYSFSEINGMLIPKENYNTTDPIYVKPLTTYTWSSYKEKTLSCYFIDINNNVLSVLQNTGKSIQINTPSNCRKIIISIEGNIDINQQLEEGFESTDYEDYKESYTLICDPLFSINNYKDTQDFLNNKITRNIGVKVLNGTENWSMYNSGVMILPNLPHKKDQGITCLCTHFKSVNNSNISSNMKVGEVKQATSTENTLFKTNFINVNEWTNYLKDQYSKGTPVIIVYLLPNSIIENTLNKNIKKGNSVFIKESSLDLDITENESLHTIPTPTDPLNIVCNNGIVLNLLNSKNITTNGNPEQLIITGKNLFDSFNINEGKILDNLGSETNNYNYLTSDYISVKEGDNITISWKKQFSNNEIVKIDAFNIHKEWLNEILNEIISENIGKGVYKTIIIPKDCCYIKFSLPKIDTNIQVEKNTRPTKYENYIKQVLNVPNLFSINDYKDIYDIKTGVLTKKIGIRILDGTENLVQSKTYPGAVYESPLKEDWITNNLIFCTHFEGISNINNYSKNKIIINNGYLSIWYTDVNDSTCVDITKKFLSDQYSKGTPVIIVYPLVNEIKEEIKDQYINIVSGTNTIERLSKNIDNLEIQVSYKKLR